MRSTLAFLIGLNNSVKRPPRLRSTTSGWATNWNKHTIDYDESLSGGPPRDGIPSIDDPKFISRDAAGEWLGCWGRRGLSSEHSL